eukprot:64904-Pyramimonas_sp.AAC.3
MLARRADGSAQQGGTREQKSEEARWTEEEEEEREKEQDDEEEEAYESGLRHAPIAPGPIATRLHPVSDCAAVATAAAALDIHL